MLYKFITVVLASIVLIALGSMSVWVKVLAIGFKAAIAVAGILAIYILANTLWRRYRQRSIALLEYKP